MLVCWKNRGDLSTVSVPIWDVGLHSSGLQRALDPVHKRAAADGATWAGKGQRGCTTKCVHYHYNLPGKILLYHNLYLQKIFYNTYVMHKELQFSYKNINECDVHPNPDAGGTLASDLLKANTTYYLA